MQERWRKRRYDKMTEREEREVDREGGTLILMKLAF